MDETGVAAWYDEQYNRYFNTLVGVGNAHIHYDPVLRNSVEDCVNEAFFIVWAKRKKLRTDQSLYPFLKEVLFKKLDNLRARRSTQVSQHAVSLDALQAADVRDPDAERRLEAWILENENEELLERLVALLSKQENEIYEEYFIKCKRAEAIRKERGMTLGAVRATIRRIRRKARQLISKNLFCVLLAVGTLLTFFQIKR